MRFDLATRVFIPEDVLSQEVSGETVLLELSSERYFGLDSVGTRIWQLLGEGRTIGEVLSLMLDEYDVSEEQLHADIMMLLEKLHEAGLIRPGDSGPPE